MKYDYAANDISFSDFEAVKRRLAAAEAARKAQAGKELHSGFALRTPRVKRGALTAKPFGSSLASLASTVKSNSFQTGLAGVLIAGMAGFFGVLAADVIGERREAAFDAQCRAKDLKYVTRSGAYCADSDKFAHEVTADGVTGRLSVDWRANESALRDAEVQASHK